MAASPGRSDSFTGAGDSSFGRQTSSSAADAAAGGRRKTREPGDKSGLSWRKVGWRAGGNPADKKVLQDLTGRAPRGEVTAVLGPSGSGKTTLLDVLAMRKTLGHTEGEVHADGQPRRRGDFQRASAYVPHEDVFLPTLTVLETMQYHAEMRMPHCQTGAPPGADIRHERIQETLRLVGLSRAQRTMVGGALPGGLTLRGLSGGERKRLGIATAMLPEPDYVFADEPNSGLDALASLQVMQVLQDVAARGRAVMVTVHQPRAAIWRLFDGLYLLADGHLMYAGHPCGAPSWFASIGYEMPPDANIADWLLDLVSVSFDKVQLGWRTCKDVAEVADAATRFASSQEMALLRAEVELCCSSAVPGLNREDSFIKSRANFWWSEVGSWTGLVGRGVSVEFMRLAPRSVQLRTLLWRHALNYSRNLGNVVARLCLSVASGLLVGFCYSGLAGQDPQDSRSVPDRLGALFFVCLVLMITPNCTMALFAADRRFFAAESAAGLYGSLSYYLPLAFCELALNLVAAALFWAPVSLLAGMEGGIRLFYGCLLCGLIQLCGAQIVNLSAMLVPSQDLAFVVSVALNIFAFITSGFLIRTSDLPWGIKHARFLSPVKMGFQALTLNELEKQEYGAQPQLLALRTALVEATPSEWHGKQPPPWWLRHGADKVSNVLDEALPCVDPCLSGMVATGREALDCLELLEPSDVSTAVFSMLAQLFALHVVGWLCLRHLHKERR